MSKLYKEYYFSTNNSAGLLPTKREAWDAAKQTASFLRKRGGNGYIKIDEVSEDGSRKNVFFARVGSPCFERHFGQKA